MEYYNLQDLDYDLIYNTQVQWLEQIFNSKMKLSLPWLLKGKGDFFFGGYDMWNVNVNSIFSKNSYFQIMNNSVSFESICLDFISSHSLPTSLENFVTEIAILMSS